MTEQEQDTLFGFPIVWIEEKFVTGDVILADWSCWADGQRHLRCKEEEAAPGGGRDEA